MSTETTAFIELIKSCGYRVFMRKPTDKYCFYTDGKRIGYAQWSDYRTSVCSVHMPSRENGTGFSVADAITTTTLADAINCTMPNWARGSVIKYKDWDAYHNASKWNSELVEV